MPEGGASGSTRHTVRRRCRFRVESNFLIELGQVGSTRRQDHQLHPARDPVGHRTDSGERLGSHGKSQVVLQDILDGCSARECEPGLVAEDSSNLECASR